MARRRREEGIDICGIAGVFAGRGRPAPEPLLLEMAGELAHRGPDGVGLYLDGSFGMVSTRLSIIDLEGGDQPLATEDGRFWVMQNGEIYNYPELMAELEALGHRFATRSDTEVLAHAYEAWGEACLERLNGEFAFAVWDRERREVFLARDRFGIRPLFLARLGGDVAFASEAKALLRHPAAERRIDPLALVETFTLWAPQPDLSAFAGVFELPPGHHARIDERGLGDAVPWWDVRFGPREGTRHERPEALVEELRGLLDEATRIRLRADVPVAVYLSGGLDSSATAAIARRHTNADLQAFGVGFEDARFDESGFQDRMADALGVRLRRITVSGADIANAFPEVVERAEKPMLRTAPGPLLRLSREVRAAGFKVVLTGEGADELFAGYGIFQEAMIRRFWARQPDSRLRPALLARVYPYLSRDLAQGGGFMAGFFRQGLLDLDDPLYSHGPRFRTTARALRFLAPSVRVEAAARGDPEARLRARLPAAYAGFGPLGQAQYLEIATFLTGFLLHSQGDRMLMGNSVEGRFPFLDVHVAEFAAALPERLRLRDLEEKHLLRRAVGPLLPPEIGARPKRPYRAPILRAFFGPGAPEYVRELLEPERMAAAGLLAPDPVVRLAAKAERYVDAGLGEGDEMALVGVLSTMLLHERLV
ncbi:MAG: asparagine synthase (glutamine-hydrolyzing), partial [Burkholderiaceae bacterium]|nr:asparagine synthase (glutamine-hydrolyzing) [Burkholderiaceae bacterium]